MAEGSGPRERLDEDKDISKGARGGDGQRLGKDIDIVKVARGGEFGSILKWVFTQK